MRVVLYSDVHAIFQAIRAFEAELKALQPDAAWFLGDIVGRGPSPHRTAAKVQAIFEAYGGLAVLGNHDMSALGRLSNNVIQVGHMNLTEAGFTVELLKQHQDHAALMQEEAPRAWEWMSQLPLRAMPLPGFYAAHGIYVENNDLRTIWDYGTKHNGIMNEQLQLLREYSMPPRLVMLGHSHVAGLWQQREGIIYPYDIWGQDWIVLENLSSQPAILNTGTLSLPRLENQQANYVILEISDDLETIRVGFRHLVFDWRALISVFCDGYVNAERMRQEIMRNPLPEGIEPSEGR